MVITIIYHICSPVIKVWATKFVLSNVLFYSLVDMNLFCICTLSGAGGGSKCGLWITKINAQVNTRSHSVFRYFFHLSPCMISYS